MPSPSCPKQLRGKASIWRPPSLAIPRVGLPHSIPRYEVNRLPITSALPLLETPPVAGRRPRFRAALSNPPPQHPFELLREAAR
jgi:hypothetical protein